MKVRDLILSTALLLLSAAAAAEPLEMFNNRLFVPVRVNGVAATALLDVHGVEQCHHAVAELGVARVVDRMKVEILFQDGARTMAQGQSG